MRNESATYVFQQTLPKTLLRKMIASGKSVPSTRSVAVSVVANAIVGTPNLVEELEPAGAKT